MKTRDQVVRMPEIVEMRRALQAAHAAWKEAYARIASPGTRASLSNSSPPGRKPAENDPAPNPAITEPERLRVAWERLSKAYDARVAEEMARLEGPTLDSLATRVDAVIQHLVERARTCGWGEWREVLAWAGIPFCSYMLQSREASALHLALEKAGVRIDNAMPEPVRFRAPVSAL